MGNFVNLTKFLVLLKENVLFGIQSRLTQLTSCLRKDLKYENTVFKCSIKSNHSVGFYDFRYNLRTVNPGFVWTQSAVFSYQSSTDFRDFSIPTLSIKVLLANYFSNFYFNF